MAKKTQNAVDLKIIVTILATALVLVLVFLGLILSGAIKVGDSSSESPSSSSSTGSGSSADTSDSKIIDNPNKLEDQGGVTRKIGDLSFQLPAKFKEGTTNDGSYVYDLMDDDGWASVYVYAEETSKSPMAFLNSKNDSLEKETEVTIYGQKWVQAENGVVLAYATSYGNKVYAIIYSQKISSKVGGDAMVMIPRTLYFEKLYK